MIEAPDIRSTLQQLDTLYRKIEDSKMEILYSKLALLELCGWVEESMDGIVKRYADRVLTQEGITYVDKKVIEPTYGFDYDRHFRKMLINVVGLKLVEKIECEIDSDKYSKLIDVLHALKEARNRHAHTHIRGTSKKVNAPSTILQDFQDVYEGLKEFENALQQLR